MSMTPTVPSSDPMESEDAALLSEALAPGLDPSTLKASTRAQLMDLLDAPRAPIDRNSLAYRWQDVGPGLKLHLVSEDPDRGVKRCLVWGRPGASTARHGHGGDEVILVLEGTLQDHRGLYGPGEICRSGIGDVHQEQVVGETDCVCFVVYYGDLIPV